MPQSRAQSVDGFFGFRSCVNQGNGIFFDEVDVDGADVEGVGRVMGMIFIVNFRSQISNLRFMAFGCELLKFCEELFAFLALFVDTP